MFGGFLCFKFVDIKNIITFAKQNEITTIKSYYENPIYLIFKHNLYEKENFYFHFNTRN